MSAKHGLGRGLGALIQDTPPTESPKETTAGVVRVPLARIRPSPWQPRRRFAADALAELADSIRERGVLQPLLVRRVGEGYELIAGERRFRAAAEAGLSEVPVILMEATDHEALELALVENLQRQDLNVIEEAEGYRALAEKFGLTQEDIARRVGKARASVANSLRLLNLPVSVRQFLSEGLLTSGHAKALLSLEIEAEQCRLAEQAVRDGMSVRELERIVARIKRAPRKPRESRSDIPANHLNRLSEALHQRFGTAVRVEPCRTLANGKKIKGSIQIDYYSNEDLDRVLGLLGVSGDL